MTTKDGQLTWAAKRAKGVANSVEANKSRRRREPPSIDWDEAIANLFGILDDDPPRVTGQAPVTPGSVVTIAGC